MRGEWEWHLQNDSAVKKSCMAPVCGQREGVTDEVSWGLFGHAPCEVLRSVDPGQDVRPSGSFHLFILLKYS